MNLHSLLTSARTISTPAATMRTLASPTTDVPMPVAVWRTDLPANASGPLHTIDSDQLVVVVSGALEVRVDGRDFRVEQGDALKLPGGVARVIKAAGGAPASTLTVGQPAARAQVGENAPVAVPWTT